MKRRDFVKGLTISAAAGSVLPASGCLSPGQDKPSETGQSRNKKGYYLENYSVDCPARSGIALGGIGAGSVELRKNGKFYNWSIFNNYPKETGPFFHIPPGSEEDPMSNLLFFTVRYQIEGQEPQMKLLQINDDLTEGAITGMAYYFPWMKAVKHISYAGRFPFINMRFSDPEMPFDIELEAYNPFIPHDIKNSSLPLANFNFKISSKTNKKVEIMLMSSLRNNVGYDHPERYYVTRLAKSSNYVAANMTVGGMDKTASSFGQQVLASVHPESTYYFGWSHRHPYYEYVLRHNKLPNLDDTDGVESILKTRDKVPEWMPKTGGRNKKNPETGKKSVYKNGDIEPGLYSTVARTKTLNGQGKAFNHSFIMTWNFPNLYAEEKKGVMGDRLEGHYYNNFFQSALEVLDYGLEQSENLHGRSMEFLNNFFDSSLDTFVLEQVNSQLNTFITSGRLIRDGSFGIQEGLAPHHSWGPLATMDVSLYGSVPILALFPELQKNMMHAHKEVQTEHGEVAHGLHKNFSMFEDGTAGVSDRIDLPSQYIIMALRDYFWTRDKKYLEKMWPSLKKAMGYVLNDLDVNGDQMPDMEGPRSSYDNFPMFGLASYIQSQWLCAMASMAEAAPVVGDIVTKEKCEKILAKGKKLMDDKLWNGEYYILYNDYDGAKGKGDKDQGCLTDQIIGQWAAHLSNLGYILNKEHVKKALQSILDMSFKKGEGLRNASWPGTKWWSDIPRDIWVDQGNTYWTGVELEFASFLIYEGFVQDGLKVIQAVDKRYREAGLYWDHQEFGGHYYRPMSAWAIINAMLGFSANQGTYTFKPKLDKKSIKLFFAFPEGTAHFSREGNNIRVNALTGKWSFDALELDPKLFTSDKLEVSLGNRSITDKLSVKKNVKGLLLKAKKPITVAAGSELLIQSIS